jgi:acyl carrier protein
MQTHDLLSEILGGDFRGTPDDAKLADLPGWDSLKAVRLILRLEEVVGHALEEDEVGGLERVGDIAQLIRNGSRP